MNSPLPTFSVIVPAFNEEAFIGACIRSIRETGWPADKLQIVVVDNASTDRTAQIAAEMGATVIRFENGRIGAIRNAGLSVATGTYVAYVDGDCTVPRTWLNAAAAAFATDPEIGAIGGPCLSPVDGTWVERSLAETKVAWTGSKKATSLATSSFITRRELVTSLGGFNEQLRSGEDDELSARIRERGLILQSIAECHVVHHGYPDSMIALSKKQVWHGSNQLEASHGFDLTLLLTHVTLSSLFIAIAALILMPWAGSKSWIALGIALVLHLAPGLIYALKKVRATRSVQNLPQWTLIGLAYFAGRSIGLLQNYKRRLTGEA